MARDGSDGILSWPWREGCDCKLLHDGREFLPRIQDQICQARKTIDIELYICESGELFEQWYRVLEQKAAEGLRIRLLLDSIGSEGLCSRDRRRLEQLPLTLRWFNRPFSSGFSLARDHRKVVVVDGSTAWVGGMGISDDLDPRVRREKAWLDAMVEIRGPVVDDWCALFEQAWNQADRPIGRFHRWRQTSQARRSARGGPEHEAQRTARVVASRGGLRNPLLFSLLRRIARARKLVWLNTPYFFPPRRLVNALVRAGRRGVEVHLGVPGPITDHPSFRYAGQHYYSRLLRAGVHIHEFQPRFVHLKAAVVDEWCTLGSCNYDRWDNYLNLDANIEVIDPEFRAELLELRAELERQSILIDDRSWSERPWTARLRQGFWFWVGVRTMRLLSNPEKE